MLLYLIFNAKNIFKVILTHCGLIHSNISVVGTSWGLFFVLRNFGTRMGKVSPLTAQSDKMYFFIVLS